MSSTNGNSNSFFEEHYQCLEIWGKNESNSGLRECQLGALWAAWAHFTAMDEPALVSLPTGAGKTALMMALSFLFRAKRVLIITPSQVLRHQTAEKFRSLDDLKRNEVLDNSISSPLVFSNGKRLGTLDEWQELAKYDVVIATPKTTSPKEQGVCIPPKDLFDLVFLDEGHHSAAPTWKPLLDAFENSKRILLTATPFRRDRRRLRARLIYHYSISRAIKADIYRPVKYHPVEVGNIPSQRDEALASEAKKILAQEQKLGNDPRLLVRADTVKRANKLVGVYRDKEIRIDAVHSKKKWSENSKTIEFVRDGRLDAMICVGMLGEGLDIPALKIAVLHDTPRSLPLTVQIVGRVSRSPGAKTGDAHLLSAPDEAREKMRELHRRNADWRELIPKLADEAVERISGLRQFRPSYAFQNLDIDPLAIEPFFSVRVYDIKAEKVDLLSNISDEDLPNNVGICYCSPQSMDPLAIITEKDYEPNWAKEAEILETKLDLHVFYYHESQNLLFEATTSDSIAKYFRRAICHQKEPIKIQPEKVIRALQNVDASEYFMVGLRNVSGSSSLHPGYKTLMGAQVQTTVRLTDGKTFTPGHALVELSKTETRGIGTEKGRIWSAKRDRMNEFLRWCDRIASDLSHSSSIHGLPQLDFLAVPKSVNQLVERPLAIRLKPELRLAERRITLQKGKDQIIGNIYPKIEICRLTNDGVLDCVFHFHSAKKYGIRLQYSPVFENFWHKDDIRDLHIRLEFSDSDIFEGNLLDFLQEYPPALIMPSGGVIIGSTLYKSESGLRVPEDLIDMKAVNWCGCDIKKEVHSAENLQSVHERTEELLKHETSPQAIIVKDHGSGEIADFIVVESTSKRIGLYHCKKSGGKKPSARITDAYEVLGQACQSFDWVSSKRLIKELCDHIET